MESTGFGFGLFQHLSVRLFVNGREGMDERWAVVCKATVLLFMLYTLFQ